MQQWMAAAHDPQILRGLAAEARALTVQRYANFFTQLKLSPERAEALSKLLDDKRQTPLDLAVASFKNGIDPRSDLPAFEAKVTAARDGIEEEIQALLGQAGYADYLRYNTLQGVSNTFVRFQRFTEGNPEVAFNPAQTAQLTRILDEGSGQLTERKIIAAEAFLSPAQIAVLREVMSDQRGVVRTRIIQALPPSTDGK